MKKDNVVKFPFEKTKKYKEEEERQRERKEKLRQELNQAIGNCFKAFFDSLNEQVEKEIIRQEHIESGYSTYVEAEDSRGKTRVRLEVGICIVPSADEEG